MLIQFQSIVIDNSLCAKILLYDNINKIQRSDGCKKKESDTHYIDI